MNKNPVLPFLFCLVPIAASWMFDMPQILAIPLKHHNNLDQDKTLLMYSFYAIPNLIFVFCGGFIVNKFGSIIFLVCILIAFFGNTVFCTAVYFNSYTLMLFGRLFVGIGIETGITASYYTLVNYFKGEHVRFYLSAIIIVCQSTELVNLYVTPRVWLNTMSLFWPAVLSEVVSLLSIACYIVFWYANPQIHTPVAQKDNVEMLSISEEIIKQLKDLKTFVKKSNFSYL